MPIDRAALNRTLSRATDGLLAARTAAGFWEGELSSSALSTATAAFALATVNKRAHAALVRRGLDWLARNRNADGGWGDTILSPSNLSTTLLCWAALAAAPDAGDRYEHAITRAGAWLGARAGGLGPASLARAVARRYGKDRTFSAPILTMCAVAGRLGPNETAWRRVAPLPFELAACPHRWFKWLRLPVVSYALPALIAVGQVRFHHRPPLNPVTRLLRRLTRQRTLQVLREIQPASGGFIEAVPLTSFVVLSLAAAGHAEHEVAARGARFLTRTVRDDGSWPIDTNLATWVTTLSVNALAANPNSARRLDREARRAIRDWLLAQHHRNEHPYTHADPGGWAWTDLPGGVPDADDTAGALTALRNLGDVDEKVLDAAARGTAWLLGLQNRDGGIPTFCRGWGALPFDRSAADLTAHALRAWVAWLDDLPPALKPRARTAINRGIAYLARARREDGTWVPLWFGNTYARAEENPAYGTARVVTALAGLARCGVPRAAALLGQSAPWLCSARNLDGGWGGEPGAPSSIEETALAVDALACAVDAGPEAALSPGVSRERLQSVISRGVGWLIEHTEEGTRFAATPIGLYFARLWYFERLYPLIFTVGALGRVQGCKTLSGPPEGLQ